MQEIEEQQKKASCLCEDIVYKVVEMAKREGFRVICSPFEADSQLISLMNQGIIDLVVTKDSDIPFQGCNATLMKLSKTQKTGRCCFVRRPLVLKKLKDVFESTRDLLVNKMCLNACMMGTDYNPQVKGEGFVCCVNKMKEYVKCDTYQQDDWIFNNHILKLDIVKQKPFYNGYKKILKEFSLNMTSHSGTVSNMTINSFTSVT